jgi:uncharacterized membrane protein YfcA
MMLRFLTAVGIGAFAGVLAGLFGLGGGVVIVPALTMLLGMPTTRAVGTSLAALLLPVGALAVVRYAKAGEVDFKIATSVAVALAIAAPLGASIALGVGERWLTRIFGVLLVALGIRFLATA